MKNNMNEDAKPNPAEDSPLYAAIAEGHYSIVELFLNHILGHPPAGGSRNTTVDNVDSSDLINESCDKLGRCPLSVAAAEGQVGVIELLLSRNADIECKSVENGLSPLIWAIIGKNFILWNNIVIRNNVTFYIIQKHFDGINNLV